MRKLLFIILLTQISFSTIDKIVAQNIYTLAGNGVSGFAGDSSSATNAQLMSPTGVAFDASGNVYIADRGNNRIRKVDISGIISTFAGTGVMNYSGDGALAINAELGSPNSIAIDRLGIVYFSDMYNHRVRKVDTSGVITTIAGTGVGGYSGDGGLAINAKLQSPTGLTIDVFGNIYIADPAVNCIRKINSMGIISTFAGTGFGGASGNGGPAIYATLNNPQSVTKDISGNVYIADYYNHKIRKVNIYGFISTFAGTGLAGFSGDGGLAINAQLDYPSGITTDAFGNIYITDNANHRIRKVDTLGFISTIGGTGINGFSGDGGPAISSQLNTPFGIAVDSLGNIFIADNANNRIRVICQGSCFLNTFDVKNFNKNLFVSPNPNNGKFKIQIDNKIEQAEIILINSIGQNVYKQTTRPGENWFDLKFLNPGIYFYVLYQDKIPIFNGKLILE